MIASALGSRNNTLGNTFPEHSSAGTPTPLDTASTASIGQHSTSTVLTEKQPGPSNSQAKLPGQGRLTPLPALMLQKIFVQARLGTGFINYLCSWPRSCLDTPCFCFTI